MAGESAPSRFRFAEQKAKAQVEAGRRDSAKGRKGSILGKVIRSASFDSAQKRVRYSRRPPARDPRHPDPPARPLRAAARARSTLAPTADRRSTCPTRRRPQEEESRRARANWKRSINTVRRRRPARCPRGARAEPPVSPAGHRVDSVEEDHRGEARGVRGTAPPRAAPLSPRGAPRRAVPPSARALSRLRDFLVIAAYASRGTCALSHLRARPR